MESYPEKMDCTKCLAYNANIGMDRQCGARWGELTLLSTHACSAVLGEGDTSTGTSCCLYDENTNQCGLFFGDEFLHACAYCGDFDVENISEIRFPKAEHCTTCTKYYPLATIDDPKGEISSLTNHACRSYGSYDNDISNCCLYDETTERCGVFENESFRTGDFLYPCGVCDAAGEETGDAGEETGKKVEETGKKVGLGIGISAGLLFLILCCWWYLRKRSQKITTNEHNNIAANEVPTPFQQPPSVTVPIDTNIVAVPVEVPQVLYAEVVDVKVNDGIPSAPELPPPIPAPAVSRPMKNVRSELPSEGLKPWSIPRPPAASDFPLDVSPRGVINLPYIEGKVTSCSIDMLNPRSNTSYYAYELVVTPPSHYDSKENMGILPPGKSKRIRITLRPLFCNRGKYFLNCSEVKVKIRTCTVHASSAEHFLHMASSIEDTLIRKDTNEAMWREVIATKAHVHDLDIPLRHI